MTRDEVFEKAKEEGAKWVMDGTSSVLFWTVDEEGRLDQCAVVTRSGDEYTWFGWIPSILHAPFEGIMEPIV